jgi:DNA-binding MltR family transcriptional regulator
MSPSNNMFEMSLFFTIVYIKAIEDMVCEDIALFQEIWEQTDEEQKEASFFDIRRYFRCREDINMGWINMHWGVF